MSDPDVIRQKGQRIELRCPTCRDAVKPGLLWLGGKDYVECPDCGGPSGGHPGVFRMWEKTITPPKVFVVGGFTHSPTEQVAVPVKIKE